jgi:putative membrane protein
MAIDRDPRVYFSAERTLLAWLRTGLAVIGLGFVVARFGLFLRIATGEPVTKASHSGSTFIGVTLVALGAISIAVAAWKHISFSRTLGDEERPPKFWISSAVLFSLLLAGLGAVLAITVASTPIK